MRTFTVVREKKGETRRKKNTKRSLVRYTSSRQKREESPQAELIPTTASHRPRKPLHAAASHRSGYIYKHVRAHRHIVLKQHRTNEKKSEHHLPISSSFLPFVPVARRAVRKGWWSCSWEKDTTWVEAAGCSRTNKKKKDKNNNKGSKERYGTIVSALLKRGSSR